MDMVLVHIQHHASGEVLTLQLPRDTAFSALTPMLYERKFLEPQRPGYRYLYQDHLCGTKHALGDYIPDTAMEIDLRVFHIPYVI